MPNLIRCLTVALLLAAGLGSPASAVRAANPAPEAASSPTPTAPETVDDTIFEATLKQHLDAISTRNLKDYAATLTRSPELYFVLADGKLIPNRSGVIDYMRKWFTDTNWRIRFERLRTLAGNDSTLVFFHSVLDGKDSAGQSTHAEGFATLLFRREVHGWALVHEQNTPIATRAH